MSTNEEIARAFSGHTFAEAYPHLAQDVHWDIVGGSPIEGRDAVIAACEQTAEYLASATTTFRKFDAVVGSDAVVIDSLAEYTGADGESSVVASCDIYRFAGDQVTAIVSYTVQITDG